MTRKPQARQIRAKKGFEQASNKQSVKKRPSSYRTIEEEKGPEQASNEQSVKKKPSNYRTIEEEKVAHNKSFHARTKGEHEPNRKAEIHFWKCHKIQIGFSNDLPVSSSVPKAFVPQEIQAKGNCQAVKSSSALDLEAKEWKPLADGIMSKRWNYVDEPIHTEGFGGVWGRVWLARKRPSTRHRRKKLGNSTQRCELRRLRIANSHLTETEEEGMPYHGCSEIVIYTQLGNSHCVDLLEIFSLGSKLQLSYAFYEWDLFTYMEAHSPEANSIQSLSRQLLVAVDHLHRRGIVHRNIKRQNVLVCQKGKLVLAGMCSATMAYPNTKHDKDGYRSNWAIRAPELLLGPWSFGPAQDLWSCGVVMARLCGFEFSIGDGNPAAEEQQMSGKGESKPPPGDGLEMEYILPIFQRLGTPASSHPLRRLPRWKKYESSQPQHWDRRGWEEKMELLGCAGVRLLDAIMDLDADCRLSAEAALGHEYFRKAPPGPGDFEVFLDGESFIQAFCTTGCQDWRLETDKENFCEDIDMHLASNRLMRPDLPEEEQVRNAAPTYSSNPQNFGCAWNSLCHRSFAFYLDKDFAIERSRQIHRLVSIKAMNGSSLSKSLPSPVVQIIYKFCFAVHSSTVHPLGCNITTIMRAILNEWLSEVAVKYNFSGPVLFLAVDLVDSYLLADASLEKKYFQLLGVAALSIASKIYEEHAPPIANFAYITDKAYTTQQVIDFEAKLVHKLRNVNSTWGCFHFFAYYTNELLIPSLGADMYSKRHFRAGLMCLERGLLTYHLTRYVPSLLAAAACLLAADMLTKHDGWEAWELHGGPGRQLCELSGRSFEKLVQVAEELGESFHDKPDQKGRLEAFTKTFGDVANLVSTKSYRASLQRKLTGQ